MAQSANIQSIDALKKFRSSLVKFAEAAELSLAEADAELAWTLTNIRSDRYRYWKAQVFTCTEQATEARLALKRRRIFERAVQGTPSSCFDEVKALRRAERRLEIAQRTYKRVQHWLVQLDLEKNRFKGASQKMRDVSEGRIPRALAQLDRLVDALESYVHLAPPETNFTADPPISSPARLAPLSNAIPQEIENNVESLPDSTDIDQDMNSPSNRSENDV